MYVLSELYVVFKDIFYKILGYTYNTNNNICTFNSINTKLEILNQSKNETYEINDIKKMNIEINTLLKQIDVVDMYEMLKGVNPSFDNTTEIQSIIDFLKNEILFLKNNNNNKRNIDFLQNLLNRFVILKVIDKKLQ